jgi:uncharacterized membrane protein
MGIGIFKKIKLANKIIDAYKRISEIAEMNHPKAEELKKILSNLKANFDALLAQLPWLKDVYNEVKEVL